MMKTDTVIDSFAWIEYFHGGIMGRQVVPYIEDGHGMTPLIVVAELSAFYAREGLSMLDWEKDLHFIESKTALVVLTSDIAKRAGWTRQKMRQERPKFGLIDAIIYEMALSFKASVISGDPHFEGLPHVIFLKD